MKVYQQLADCARVLSGNELPVSFASTEQRVSYAREKINWIEKNMLPSGSGFDCGTAVDESSRENRLVLTTCFHHMNLDGYYDGWTSHKVIVTPSLISEFDLRVTGRDRNEIKDYIGDVFHHVLTNELPASFHEFCRAHWRS